MTDQKKPETVADEDLDTAQGGSGPRPSGWWNPDVASELQKTGDGKTGLDTRKTRPGGVLDTMEEGETGGL